MRAFAAGDRRSEALDEEDAKERAEEESVRAGYEPPEATTVAGEAKGDEELLRGEANGDRIARWEELDEEDDDDEDEDNMAAVDAAMASRA